MVLNYGINNHQPLDCLNFPKAIYEYCRFNRFYSGFFYFVGRNFLTTFVGK